MPANVEQEPKFPVTEHPETPEIPEHIESVTGVRVVPTAVTAQVQDSQGNNLINTPANSQAKITIPQTQATLTAWSKGDIGSAVTWWGRFWLRMIKKAIHFGWGVQSKEEKT